MTTITKDAGRGVPAMGDTASDAMQTARQLGRDISREVTALVSDAEDLLHNTADVMGGQTAAARARLKSRLKQVKNLVGDGFENFKRQGSQIAGASDDFVRARPWQVMGAAALVGVALGFVLSRR